MYITSSVIMIRCLVFYIIIHNQGTTFANDEISEDSDKLKNAPPDHIIPYSEHENPSEPEYMGPGKWAKLAHDKNISLDFVPTRLYTQVRATDVVKRVPRKELMNTSETDEERKNAGRLAEVISKKKINTVYTEEGYEDAAYDHGGHERAADFNENYQYNTKKPQEFDSTDQNDFDSENSFHRVLPNNKIYPQYVTENEIAKLQNYLLKEDKEAAERAEVEVPKNLRDLSDDSKLSDYEDTGEQVRHRDRDYDYTENLRESARSTTVFTEIPVEESQSNRPIFISHEKLPVTFYSTPSTFYEVTTPLNTPLINPNLLSKRNLDDGKVFLKFYKTLKPNHGETTTVAPKIINSFETVTAGLVGSLEGTEDHYPSLSKIYETWKRHGIEETDVESFSENEASLNNGTPTASTIDGKVAKKSNKQLTTDKNRNKSYTMIIRVPTTSCNNSILPKTFNHSYENLSVKTKLPGRMNTVMHPPPIQPLDQVTYANFLPDSNLMKSSITQESGPTPETNSDSFLSSHYRYHPHQRNWPSPMSGQDSIKHHRLVGLNKMLPPSPISKSQYAQYQNKNENVEPKRDLWSDIFRNHKPVFYLNARISRSVKTLSTINQRLGNNKNIFYPTTRPTTIHLRHKRSTGDLFEDAPRVVQDVVDKEINLRFPENDENHPKLQSANENNQSELHLPKFNFSNDEKIKRHESNILIKAKQRNNSSKYPFYGIDRVSDLSPIKYVINPLQVPQKTLGGTEFYDSRDRYMQCDEINPNLSQVPENEEPVTDGRPQMNIRLRGLGDKLSCYRDKYFDQNPLDNPLFMEKQIRLSETPEQFQIHELKSRVSNFPSEKKYDIKRNPNKRQITNLSPTKSKRSHVTSDEKINVSNNHAKRSKKRRLRNNKSLGLPDLSYEKQVYDDVIGTIKNMNQLSLSTNPNHKIIKSISPLQIASSSRPSVSSLKYNRIPYKINKASYKIQPKYKNGHTDQIHGYLRTVRVHKRSIIPDLVSLESKDISRSSLISKRILRTPVNVSSSSTTPRSTKKVIDAFKEQGRNSKPRGSIRYRDFMVHSTATTVDSRRNEPRYTPIRKFDDVYKVEYTEKNRDSNDSINEDDDEITNNDSPKAEEQQYDVHENIQEEQVKVPIIPKSRNEASKNDSHESDGKHFDEGINVSAGDESNEQTEKPSKSYFEDSNDGSGEIYGDEKSSEDSEDEAFVTEVPNLEKEFDRFVFRPFSPFESYDDPKYSHLGPRINKPAFNHRSFNYFKSPKSWKLSETHDNSDESKEDKYVYPRHMDNEDSSQESKRYYPWKRREHFARERRNFRNEDQNDEEPSYSETMIKFGRVYPWHQRQYKPSTHFDTNIADKYWPKESFYNVGFSSQFVNATPTERYSETLFKTTKNSNIEIENPVTTLALQIPTSASIIEQTSPMTYSTSSIQIYPTIRSKAKVSKTTLQNPRPNINMTASSTEQPFKILKRDHELKALNGS